MSINETKSEKMFEQIKEIVKKHESNNKKLSRKLSIAKMEIEEMKKHKETLISNLAKTEFKLQNALCENETLSSNIKRLKDKKNVVKSEIYDNELQVGLSVLDKMDRNFFNYDIQVW